ncbi:glycosyltransferase family 2 protein [Mycoplasmopsis adleri]|uniref:glycosyltransferase family 2 protein n=1 Tax=Mycoplasmopsis adleri TaxID=51362 RepID=UPI003873A361
MFPKKVCTIIIPAYNMEKFIKRTLFSVIANKDYAKYINIVVINDGSTDNTQKVVEKMASEHEGIYLINKENNNWGSVINYAKHNNVLNSEYTMILDADDTISRKFSKMLVDIVQKQDIDIAVFNTRIYYYKKLSVIINPKWFTKNQEKPFVPVLIPCSIVFKTKLLLESNDLVEGVSYQDYPMFCDMLSRSKKTKLISRVLGLYWYSRPGNTMTKPWGEKRLSQELILLDQLRKQGNDFLFAARVLLPGYLPGLSKANLVLKINENDYKKVIKCSSHFFKMIFKNRIKLSIKNKSVVFTKEETTICKRDN